LPPPERTLAQIFLMRYFMKSSCVTRVLGKASFFAAWEKMFFLFIVGCVVAIGAEGQTFTTLVNFDGTNGEYPYGDLIQGTDGNFYGVTGDTVFKMTPSGVLTTLHNFCLQGNCAGGPQGPLVQGTDGSFYGSTTGASSNECACGTIFKINSEGVLTTLHSFSGLPNDGSLPYGPLVQDADGNFYGVTLFGGVHNGGTFFKVTPGGAETVLFSFTTSAPKGRYPYSLIQGADGDFYGVAHGGEDTSQCSGFGGCGTIFKITPGGTETVLHSFTMSGGGFSPFALIQGIDGSLYGATDFGGIMKGNCDPYGCGTVFRLTTGGEFSTLHQFNSSWPDGLNPLAPLVQGSDGNFYGTTVAGLEQAGYACPEGCGTIFRMTPAGAITTIYTNFLGAVPGGYPGLYHFGLLQGTDGAFYGAMWGNGSDGLGVIYKFSAGLSPFVKAQVSSGIVGSKITILGNNLIGTSGVSFHGTPADFTVGSDTYLTATVPAGATTGNIIVATPGGALNSNQEFRVLPQITSFSPASGPVGTTVVVKGESFTGATLVSLDCEWPATFTVDSDTQITLTVPENATTGGIGVRTPGGHVESVGNFTVTP
jgi:uncharacterized repeat protein (TIGR03803 family)